MRLLGVYSDPTEQTHRYPDGTHVQFVGAVFEADLADEVGTPDHEVADVAWFSPDDLPQELFAADIPVIRDALSEEPRPFTR